LLEEDENRLILWDNDSTHTSRETEAWLHERAINVIKISSRSPEFNISKKFIFRFSKTC